MLKWAVKLVVTYKVPLDSINREQQFYKNGDADLSFPLTCLSAMGIG
jgi:hypothetical protein